MKAKISLLLLLCINVLCLQSQEPQNSKVYEVRNSVAVYPCYITGKNVYADGRFSNPPLGAKFMMVKPAGSDTVVIRYLVWTKEKDSVLKRFYNDPLFVRWRTADSGAALLPPGEKGGSGEPWEDQPNKDAAGTNKNKTDSGDSSWSAKGYGNKVDRFFKIPRYDLDSNCVKVYNKGWRSVAFTIGLVTMPLKLRLGNNFDFQGNLSLGSTAGIKMRLSRYRTNYINLLLGTSLSTVSLDSFSTSGKISGQPLTNMAVFSPSLGAVFEFGKAQAGVFYGWDVLNKSNQAKYDWIYQKKPWISVGFGFSIFNVDGGSDKAAPQTQ